VELNLHPRPCPWYSLFLCWKGDVKLLSSQATNTMLLQPLYSHNTCRPVLVGTASLELEDFIEAQFYWRDALVDGNSTFRL